MMPAVVTVISLIRLSGLVGGGSTSHACMHGLIQYRDRDRYDYFNMITRIGPDTGSCGCLQGKHNL